MAIALPIQKMPVVQDKKGSCGTVRCTQEMPHGHQRKLYIESYGCQMNFSDSEIVASIMQKNGFDTTASYENADVILINTCAIRDKAEQTIRKRLRQFQRIKKNNPGTVIGVLGCMAERLKAQLLEEEKIVDLVAGPDAYRDLPKLVAAVDDCHKAVNTFLSREETYADISPVRLHSNGVTAFISIMRGCDNMCSFCVVPFTRGRERSRDLHSIVKEAQTLFDQGYREVTLLGQNVDSYHWPALAAEKTKAQLAQDTTPGTVNFAQLLAQVAQVHPDLRVRFSTSHPKDMTDDVLHTMKQYENICKYIHLPAQSGKIYSAWCGILSKLCFCFFSSKGRPMIRIYILAQQSNFSIALVEKRLGFFYNGVKIATALSAAGKGYYTKRAHIVTTTHNGNKGSNAVDKKVFTALWQSSTAATNLGKSRYASGPATRSTIFSSSKSWAFSRSAMQPSTPMTVPGLFFFIR